MILRAPGGLRLQAALVLPVSARQSRSFRLHFVTPDKPLVALLCLHYHGITCGRLSVSVLAREQRGTWVSLLS